MRVRLLGLLLVSLMAGVLAGCGGGSDNAVSDTTTAASTVPFDRAFIDAMVPHHEAAITMAQSALGAGLTQPDLIRIAQSIVDTQQGEIDQMRSWRMQWFGSSTVDPAGAADLGLSESEMGMQHGSDMSGQDDVDMAFASAMIDHHLGAVKMAELALDRAQHPELRKLATAIITAQEREVALMEQHAMGMNHG